MSLSVRRLAVLGVALTVVVVAGALALGVSVEGGPPDPESLQQRVADANRSIDTYEATFRGTLASGNETEDLVYHVVVDRPDRINVTYRAPANASGDVVVRNGTGLYSYDDGENRLVRVVANDTPTRDPIETLVDAVTGNDSEFAGEDRIDGSSGVLLQYDAGDTAVGLRIGGSAPASRFSSGDATDLLDLSVWVDPERNLPVRFRQRISVGNDTTEISLRMTELTLNPEVEDDRFRVGVTDAETVFDREVTSRLYPSRAALARNVSMSVPDPDVPEGYTLVGAARAESGGNRSVSLSYRSGQTALVVVKRRPPAPLPDAGNATRVDLGEVTGFYREVSTGAFVVWECDGATYQVTGLVGRDRLVEVAGSMACD
jgi:outer membrane lipoprotein-sorting protein